MVLLNIIFIIINIFQLRYTLEDNNAFLDSDNYRNEIDQWLNTVETDLAKFNYLSAYFTWKISTSVIDDKTQRQAEELNIARNRWRNQVCSSTIKNNLLSSEQLRKLLILCKGSKFTEETVPLYMKIMNDMTEAYNTEVCLPKVSPTRLEILGNSDSRDNYDLPKAGSCLFGEPDLDRLMKQEYLNAAQRAWIWNLWHDAVGKRMKSLYPAAVYVQNLAAKENGYSDMGQVWREDLEIENLEELVLKLYNEIKPLYENLHAVVRHKLLLKYGPVEVDPMGPIPVHLLGNMWGQDWSSLISLFITKNNSLDLTKGLQKKNWSVRDMVIQAEDMYTSLGLPPMTNEFWKYSIFEENSNTTMCHGTAANMFKPNDYRMILCANIDIDDFYVIHHEMGHIQYYMAYQNQNPIYQENVNTALHESIGDTIMHGVLTISHLNRLGLLPDKKLAGETFGGFNDDQILLLQRALFKLPELPYALLLDLYRWNIFRGRISPDRYNRAFWDMNVKLRGITSPTPRDESTFDAGAKFHIPDNTPYIRYFLSQFIQMDIFKTLCNLANGEESPISAENLHNCDIYGCKKCGKKLRWMMREGSRLEFPELLQRLTDLKVVSSDTLIEFYRPLTKWLKAYIEEYQVPVGW